MKVVVPPISVHQPVFGIWDIVAVILILGVLIFLAEASRGLGLPLGALQTAPITLDPWNLPEYAARTSLRMLTALRLSLVFTFTYATWAARSPRAELAGADSRHSSVRPHPRVHSVTMAFFMSLAPGSVLGAEFAAVFAIFTSQAWNMAFSFYLAPTIPDLRSRRAIISVRSRGCGSGGSRYPSDAGADLEHDDVDVGRLVFVVASESISVGHTAMTLPGIGSYIAFAIAERDSRNRVGHRRHVHGDYHYDQLDFRPLVAWADRLRLSRPECQLPRHGRSRCCAAICSLGHTPPFAAAIAMADRHCARGRRCPASPVGVRLAMGRLICICDLVGDESAAGKSHVRRACQSPKFSPS